MKIGMENPLISIIVPVYNIEKYIRKCVDTITRQTYKNLEIILVAGGSTDGSSAICDELAASDVRIKVLRTVNGGQAVARNRGIKASRGDYLAFVDGDDYVTADYVLHLYELMKEHHADISITNYCIQRDSGKKRRIKERPSLVLSMDRYGALETFLYLKYFGPSCWGKLFHRSLFDEIEFPEGKLAEDLEILYKLLDKTEYVVYSSVVDYVYVQRLTSSTYTQKSKGEKDVLEILEEMTQYITNKYPNLSKAVICTCWGHSIRTLKFIPFLEIYKKEHSQVRDNIIKYRKIVLVNPKVSFNTRACAALSYLGIGTLWVCKAIYDRAKSFIEFA
jgi:glycosyltransferase involved in cell wall biosynthesis